MFRRLSTDFAKKVEILFGACAGRARRGRRRGRPPRRGSVSVGVKRALDRCCCRDGPPPTGLFREAVPLQSLRFGAMTASPSSFGRQGRHFSACRNALALPKGGTPFLCLPQRPCPPRRRGAGCQWQPLPKAEAPTELRVSSGHLAQRSNDRRGSGERQARFDPYAVHCALCTKKAPAGAFFIPAPFSCR